MKARALLLFAIASSGCGWGTISRDDFDRAHPWARMTVADPSVRARAFADLERQIGGDDSIRARAILLEGDEVRIEAVSPKNATHLDGYWWSDGELETPYPLSMDGVTEEGLFAIHDLPADLRPFVGTAFDVAKVEDGYVKEVRVRRSKGTLVFDVDVEGPRGSASVVVDVTGKVTDVTRR